MCFCGVNLTVCRSRRTAGHRQGIIAQRVQSHGLPLDGLQQLLRPLLIYRGGGTKAASGIRIRERGLKYRETPEDGGGKGHKTRG